MRKNEKAAVDVGASAAAEQRNAIMCCSVPLQCDSLNQILHQNRLRVNELFPRREEELA